jgi:5-hydroxyisourate hydrolase-like protein (transthyretin family)
MKFILKIFFFILLVGVIFCNLTCKKKIFSKIKYEGYVFDSIGGQPAVGINIRLSACASKSAKTQCTSYDVGSCTTNNEGYFKIEATAARSNRYAIGAFYTDIHTGFDLTKSDLASSNYTILYVKEK